jgi:hypothetical protein
MKIKKIFVHLAIKLNLILWSLLIIVSHNQVYAKVLTVNNRLDIAVADYTSLQSAYDNAESGDTLLVFPSEIAYAGIDISKKIFLIGNGYVSSNHLPITIISGNVNFLEGSDGSSIESFGGAFVVSIVSANNILISRNNISTVVIENSFNSLLLSNLINGGNNRLQDYLIVLKNNSFVEASNNIIRSIGYHCGYSSTCYWGAIWIQGSSVININNSVIASEGQLTIYQGIARGKNNIVFGRLRSNIDFYNSIHANAVEGKLDESKNNIIVNDLTTTFIDFNNSDYHLTTNSPARGAGENGADMGIYGGDTPFVDGGYPGIPSIYYLDVPLTGSQKDGLDITIKAKSHQ